MTIFFDGSIVIFDYMPKVEIHSYTTNENPSDYSGGKSMWVLPEGEEPSQMVLPGAGLRVDHTWDRWFGLIKGDVRISRDGLEVNSLKSGQSQVYSAGLMPNGEMQYYEIFHGTDYIDRDPDNFIELRKRRIRD